MSAPPVSIRPARPVDASAVRDCTIAAYSGYVPMIGREPAPMQADFAAAIARGIVWVAEMRVGVVGAITCYPRGTALHVESVAVLPERQGNGFGRRLLAFAEDRARSEGLARVDLYTNARMTRNLAFYARLGYREIGRGCEAGFERVWFEKQLQIGTGPAG